MKTKKIVIIIFAFLAILLLIGCAKAPMLVPVGGSPSAYAEITSLNQAEYEVSGAYVDTLGNYHPPVYEYGVIEIWYNVYNTSYYEIHNYTVVFALFLDDGTYIYDDAYGTGVIDYATSYTAVETYGKQVREVVIMSCTVQ